MDGVEEYNSMYNARIENVLNKNSDKAYLRSFKNWLEPTVKSLPTVYVYVGHVASFMNFTNKSPENLTQMDVTDYMSKFSDKGSSYKINIYSALKRFFEFLYENNINENNVMLKYHRPKYIETIKTQERRENGYLNNNEIALYLEKLKNANNIWSKQDKAIIMILLSTGMRCSALMKLDVNSINFKEKTITTIDKGSKIQKYYMSDQVIKVLKEHLECRENRIKYDEVKTEALFLAKKSHDRCTQGLITSVVKKYGKEVINKNLSPHKLRATFGTQMYQNTHDIYFVQQAMGHSNPQTTELYVRGEKNKIREDASKIINNVLFRI